MLEEDEAVAEAAAELADGPPVELPADDDLDIKDSPEDSGGEDEGAEAVDSRSIPGWDKADVVFHGSGVESTAAKGSFRLQQATAPFGFRHDGDHEAVRERQRERCIKHYRLTE